MEDKVTGPTMLQQNDNRVVIKIVSQSDGTGGKTVDDDVEELDAREDGTAVVLLSPSKVEVAPVVVVTTASIITTTC